MGGGTKQGSRGEILVSVVVFQIPGLSLTAYTYLSVYNDPDSCPFQMAWNISLAKHQTQLSWVKQNLAVITPRDQAPHDSG